MDTYYRLRSRLGGALDLFDLNSCEVQSTRFNLAPSFSLPQLFARAHSAVFELDHPIIRDCLDNVK